jgi:hypothetical protein
MKNASQNQNRKINHAQLWLFLLLFTSAFFPLALNGEAPFPLTTLNDSTYFFFNKYGLKLNASSSQVIVLISLLLASLSHAQNKVRSKCKYSTIVSLKAIILSLKKWIAHEIYSILNQSNLDKLVLFFNKIFK